MPHPQRSASGSPPDIPRDQQILRAAERLFYERSFDGTGIDAIAAEVGIVGSAVYRHFRNKEDILLRLLLGAVDQLDQHTRLRPATTPADEVQRLIRAHIQVACSRPELVEIWQREQHNLSGEAATEFHRRQRRYVDQWVDSLARCYPRRARSDLLATTHALHALMMSGAARRGGRRTMPASVSLLESLATAALAGLVERSS